MRMRVTAGWSAPAVLLGLAAAAAFAGSPTGTESEVVPLSGATAALTATPVPPDVVEDARPPRAEESDEATWAGLACQQACTQAAAPSSGAPACGRRSRLSATYFCPGTDRRYINPFAILRGAGPGADVCKHSLLLEASQEATAALARTGSAQVPSSQRDLFRVASNAAANACGATRGASPSLETVRTETTAAVASEVTPAEVQSYCRAVVPPPCAFLGGSRREIAGTSTCVVGGVVVDSSCLSQSSAKLEALKGAIEALRSTGLSCLRGRPGRPGIAPEVGQGLADHLGGATPKTQLCCTTSSCSSGVPGFPQPGGTVSANAAGDSFGNARGGTIRLPPAQLLASDFKATLFHEMLHQMGLCDSSEHNSFTQINFVNWAVPKPAGGRCPAGYTERVVGRDSPGFAAVAASYLQAFRVNPPPPGIRGDFVRRYPRGVNAFLRSRNPDVVLNAADLRQYESMMAAKDPVCLKLNGCGNGVLPPPPPFIEAWDNVYACESACYAPRQMAAYSEAERQAVRESCRAPATRPAGAPLVSHDAGNPGERCISATAFNGVAAAGPRP